MRKTFLVRGDQLTPNKVSVPSRFVFQDSGENLPEYESAKEMWDAKIRWNEIRNNINSRVKGSQTEAQQIKQILLYIEETMTKKEELLSEEEKEMLVQLTKVKVGGPKQIAKTLLLYDPKSTKSKKTGKTYVNYAAAGGSFEKHIDQLFQSLFKGNRSYKTGMNRVGSMFQPIKASQLGVTNLKVGKDGKLTEISKKALQEAIKAYIGEDFGALLGSFKYEVEMEGGQISDVLVRQVDVEQKIDIEVPSTVKIKSKLTPKLAELANLVADRTFSLKNYNSFNAKNSGIFVGNTNEFRRASAFYFFATGNKNPADICTFIFASEASPDPVVKRYISWEHFLYELLGTGQLDNGRLVDYILINFYNVSGVENLIINSTKEYIKDMPNATPSFILSGGHMAPVQF